MQCLSIPGAAIPAAGFFDFKGELIENIKIPVDPTDLARQSTLTQMLMEMQPVYTPWSQQRQVYLERISQELDLPIAITPRGPTALEKESRELKPLFA